MDCYCSSVQGETGGGGGAPGQSSASEQPTPEADLTALLPGDVLAEVLRRLAPRGLATCRRVCRAWRAAVDARRLLRAELLPLSLSGVLINFHGYYITELFSRPPPATGSAAFVTGKHDYLPEPIGRQYPPDSSDRSWSGIIDHCNGLVLAKRTELDRYVLNPTTTWLAPLPLCPALPVNENSLQKMYLVYDPTVSSSYEVVSVPSFWHKRQPGEIGYDSVRDGLDPALEQSEWPPSECALHVFSSASGRWEERLFVREGDAAATIADMRSYWASDQRKAVYWRGALYVHCQADFVMRISLSSGKHKVIKLPVWGEDRMDRLNLYLGRSEKGVYCASIQGRCRLRVWMLNESCGEATWVLKNDRDLLEWLLKHKLDRRTYQSDDRQQAHGPWVLQDINYYYATDKEDDDMLEASEASLVDRKFEWSSDKEDGEDDIFEWSSDNKDTPRGGYYHGDIDILGFHPYKEIIFLGEHLTRGLAFHLNSSRVEELGNIYPEEYDETSLPNEQLIISSFPYTPCWM